MWWILGFSYLVLTALLLWFLHRSQNLSSARGNPEFGQFEQPATTKRRLRHKAAAR